MKRAAVEAYRGVQQGICRLLRPLERRALRHWGVGDTAPFLIVGAPRSGTTLLYQLCVHRFQMAYFPNLSNVLYDVPVTAARLARRMFRPYSSEFSSRHGKERGGMAPHEAGNVWDQWFTWTVEKGHYVADGELTPDQQHRMHQTVNAMACIFGAPFINKNVLNSVRLRALHEVFPHARIIWMRRDPVEVSASILRVRQRLGFRQDQWWSVMPPEIGQLRGCEVAEQAVGQVFYVERHIERNLQAIDTAHTCKIRYHDLCAAPEKALDQLQAWSQGADLSLHVERATPDRFTPSSSWEKLSKAEQASLKPYLREYFGNDS